MYKQNNNPFSRNKYGESRGEGHKRGERFRSDPADKKAFESLNQVQKDSLHGEAMKYNKPFFSPKHGVNVDPEDGVLSNRPVYSDDTKLTYDKIDKPFDSPVNKSNEPRKTTKGKGRNFRTVEEGAGMTEAGVKDYKSKNPGSNLQTAVTEKNPTGKRKSRQKSFCARSKGWTGPRGRAARARWNC
jgi:hypothetical protein